MKKSLLALAVLGAFAGAASAQSSVTVYGIVDAGFNSTDSGAPAGRVNGIASGNQSASRIGFKGTEDLGNGLKANFLLESGFNADAPGAFSFGDRISTVGLSGNFGAVNLGKQTSAIKDAYDQIDPFGDGGKIAPISAAFFGGDMPTSGRISNSVKYSSNSYSGFKFGVAYGFGESAGDTGADSNYGVNVGYANGPLNVQFGYHNQDESTNPVNGATDPVKTGEFEAAFLGATYDFGGFKLHAAYGDGKQSPVGGTESKVRNYMLGATVKVSAVGSIMASYSVNDNRTINNADAKRFGVMYAHDLSKRTNLYAGYSRTSNDNGSDLGLVAGAPAGESASVVAVGVRHKF